MNLFMKPSPAAAPDETLYEKEAVAFRSFQTSDIDMIHEWVNEPYAKRFWQMEGSNELVRDTYDKIVQSPYAHSFIGLYNNNPVCQVDVYLVALDELKHHVKRKPDDCGLHFLMAPPKLLKRGMGLTMLRGFIDFYFSFPRGKRLFAEPDRENLKANALAQKAGFQFVDSIRLPDKFATLYCITRENFLATSN